jgi:hypothetical protein
MTNSINPKPPVFRYLEQKFIDEFFTSGKLQLSSFSKFAEHPDEQRHDADEGWCVVDIKMPTKKKRLRSRVGIPKNSYILSTSLKRDQKLMIDFDRDGYFKINDVEGFGLAIASKIVGLTNLIAANCEYMNYKEIGLTMGAEAEEAIEQDEKGRMNINKVMALLRNAIFPEVYFLKLNLHAHQEEFRFVWEVGYEVSEPLIIECPEAIQYCEKIT